MPNTDCFKLVMEHSKNVSAAERTNSASKEENHRRWLTRGISHWVYAVRRRTLAELGPTLIGESPKRDCAQPIGPISTFA